MREKRSTHESSCGQSPGKRAFRRVLQLARSELPEERAFGFPNLTRSR